MSLKNSDPVEQKNPTNLGDEDINNLTLSFSSSNAVSKKDLRMQYRFEGFKPKGTTDQEKRRREFLKKQKERKEDYLIEHAKRLAFQQPIIEEQATEDENEIVVAVNDQQRKQNYKNGKRRIKKKSEFRDQLMMPENMIEIPEDFVENWLAVPCPSGKRCLVISANGSTISRLNNGSILNKFQSCLPNGCSKKGVTLQPQQFCILDCIYNEVNFTYYVLDIISWRGVTNYHCDTEFRFFWKQSKLQEDQDMLPSVGEIHQKYNPYKFICLPSFSCDAQSLHNIQYQQLIYQTETIVFFNKQTQYTSGSTPLVNFLNAEYINLLIEKLS